MKTIGEILKEARTRKKLSRVGLEKETKIKKEFIEAVEGGDWQVLPEYPVVQGFVKSIAGALKLNQRSIMALLRRDYPPKKVSIAPKPDVSDKFVWSPKLTFIAGIVLVALTLLGYLGFQYADYTSPPELTVVKPEDEEIVTTRRLVVEGIADTDAVVKVNNQPVLVGEDGSFVAEIEIFEGTQEIVVKAISRSGKETQVQRKIIPELE